MQTRPRRLALPLPAPIIYHMCNRFEYAGTFQNLADFYAATPLGRLDNTGDVLPSTLAPGLTCNRDGERELHPMQFAMAPPNSETPAHPTFTHTLANIEEPLKWPWLTAIETSRCVLPLSSLHAACYWGDPEGTEVYFHRADQALLHAAGICRVWNSPACDRQLYTMSLLMRPASDYVMDHGSHRQPIFLDEAGINPWINPHPMSCDDALLILRQHSTDPELTHRHACNMPDGWTKRQKGSIRKRGQQMAAQDRCEHACGF